MAEAERRVAGLVRGPHLRAVRREHRRNRTGCVGISISRSARGKTYYVANLGSTNRRFCIETLGRAEAFKRALQARAKHELTVQAANEVILAARNTNGHLTITPQDAHGA
jgi:aspartate aminotransferase-like enzyme